VSENKKNTRVVLLEDEDLLRGLLSEWLGSQDDLEVVGSYRTIVDFETAVLSGQVSVDLVVADLVLPDGDGLDASVKAMEQVGHHIPLVVISGRPTSGLFDRLSKDLNGGWAFLLKDSNGLASLRRAVDAVRDGLVMVDPNLKTLFANNGRNAQLTPQETQIMALVSEGMSNSGIAAKIFMSEKTVERVLSNLYLKYGLARTSKIENPRVRATLIFRGLTE
jgi:DNA-binding NarL/FixJ family response regulator